MTCNTTGVTCTSCAAPKYLYSSICVATCSDMQSYMYGENSTRVCTSCATNCSACTGSSGCSSCKTALDYKGVSYQLLNFAGVCVSVCPTNSIAVPSIYKCDKCLDNCTLCTNTIDNCSGCITNFNLYQNTANSSYGTCLNNYCPPGYFSKNGLCTKCDVSCTLCDGENYCTECLYVAGNTAK